MRLEQHKYLIMSVDPVHIGTGGYRLGRVDNAIAREPGTNLPKIPGSSLHGAIRSSAALAYGKPQAAGQKPAGDPKTCPIIYTFGSGESAEGGFQSGTVSVFDARLVFFPIASLDGPVWVTTTTHLQEAGFAFASELPELLDTGKALTNFTPASASNINLGWIMLQRQSSNSFQLKWQPFSQPISNSVPELKHILARLVIVHDSLFAHVVEAGLEVRTSVAINPETGAASDGALFTYEALPRSSVLSFDVVVDDFKKLNQKFNWPIVKKFDISKEKDNAGEDFPYNPRLSTEVKGVQERVKWERPIHVVNTGLEMLEYLGVGGMGTRGFGRIRKLLDAVQEVG
jgi:CRISPR-associated protein Cmr4